MNEVTPIQNRGFLENWLRWFVWWTTFGAGYYCPQWVALSFRGKSVDGFILLFTGVLGYAFFGVIAGAIIGLIATLAPGLRIAPTTLGGGSIRAFCIAAAFGLLTIVTGHVPGW